MPTYLTLYLIFGSQSSVHRKANRGTTPFARRDVLQSTQTEQRLQAATPALFAATASTTSDRRNPHRCKRPASFFNLMCVIAFRTVRCDAMGMRRPMLCNAMQCTNNNAAKTAGPECERERELALVGKVSGLL